MATQRQRTSTEQAETRDAELTNRWMSGTKTALSLLTVVLLLAAMVGFPLAAIAYP